MNGWIYGWMGARWEMEGERKTLLHSRMPSNQTEGSMEL